MRVRGGRGDEAVQPDTEMTNNMLDIVSPISEIPLLMVEKAQMNSLKLHPQLLASDAATSGLSLGRYSADLGWASKPRPLIFWVDFLASSTVGYALTYWSSTLSFFSLPQIGVVFLAAAFMFRASVFMHEAIHSGKDVPGFAAAYNLYFGFVNKLPLYIYDVHVAHHLQEYYGTEKDSEYEDLKLGLTNIAIPIVMMALLPALLILRFGILPWFLPFIGKRARNAVYQYASTFALNRRYKRPLPDPAERRRWYWQDAGCALYQLAFVVLCLTGVLSWSLAGAWYAVAFITMLTNYYRVMSSHAYWTGLSPTTRKQQILDSLTVTGSPWLFWLYPVGLRYHALHHMMPHVPYHHMAKLHRILLTRLPDDHPYRATIVNGFLQAYRRLPVNS
jgi:fatty acid desaturase